MYRQHQFIEAAEAYQQGLDSMRAITANAAQVFEELLQKGQQALDNNQPDAALEALELAIQMQPDSVIAFGGLGLGGGKLLRGPLGYRDFIQRELFIQQAGEYLLGVLALAA